MDSETDQERRTRIRKMFDEERERMEKEKEVRDTLRIKLFADKFHIF